MVTSLIDPIRRLKALTGHLAVVMLIALTVLAGVSGAQSAIAQGTIEPIDLPFEFSRCDVAWGVYSYAYDMMWDYAPAEAEYWYWRNIVDRAERFLEAHCGADIGF
jgi:hypothetical protein